MVVTNKGMAIGLLPAAPLQILCSCHTMSVDDLNVISRSPYDYLEETKRFSNIAWTQWSDLETLTRCLRLHLCHLMVMGRLFPSSKIV